MTPETERFLQNADDHDAGRAAYLAAFHAAQAIIFERTGKVFKSHKGVNVEFLRLTKDDAHFTPEQRRFLSRAYEFKAVADYDSGPISEVSSEQAAAGIEAARTFVAAVRHVLPPQPPN